MQPQEPLDSLRSPPQAGSVRASAISSRRAPVSVLAVPSLEGVRRVRPLDGDLGGGYLRLVLLALGLECRGRAVALVGCAISLQ